MRIRRRNRFWALMQRIERFRHRAELTEKRAAAIGEPAKSEMMEIAQEWRDLAQDVELLERPPADVPTVAPPRLRLELAIAAVGAVVAAITIAAPRWLEGLTGIDPDKGSGAFECASTAALLGVAFLATFWVLLRFRRSLKADV